MATKEVNPEKPGQEQFYAIESVFQWFAISTEGCDFLYNTIHYLPVASPGSQRRGFSISLEIFQIQICEKSLNNDNRITCGVFAFIASVKTNVQFSELLVVYQ
ncbi:hypothetical protein WA026_005682, partial [Henosepilachna vigintioctopunctata]